MTLKQAFTVAAVQQTAKAPAQLCESCPLQGLHKLCERIEGESETLSTWSTRALGGSVRGRGIVAEGCVIGALTLGSGCLLCDRKFS